MEKKGWHNKKIATVIGFAILGMAVLFQNAGPAKIWPVPNNPTKRLTTPNSVAAYENLLKFKQGDPGRAYAFLQLVDAMAAEFPGKLGVEVVKVPNSVKVYLRAIPAPSGQYRSNLALAVAEIGLSGSAVMLDQSLSPSNMALTTLNAISGVYPFNINLSDPSTGTPGVADINIKLNPGVLFGDPDSNLGYVDDPTLSVLNHEFKHSEDRLASLIELQKYTFGLVEIHNPKGLADGLYKEGLTASEIDSWAASLQGYVDVMEKYGPNTPMQVRARFISYASTFAQITGAISDAFFGNNAAIDNSGAFEKGNYSFSGAYNQTILPYNPPREGLAIGWLGLGKQVSLVDSSGATTGYLAPNTQIVIRFPNLSTSTPDALVNAAVANVFSDARAHVIYGDLKLKSALQSAVDTGVITPSFQSTFINTVKSERGDLARVIDSNTGLHTMSESLLVQEKVKVISFRDDLSISKLFDPAKGGVSNVEADKIIQDSFFQNKMVKASGPQVLSNINDSYVESAVKVSAPSSSGGNLSINDEISPNLIEPPLSEVKTYRTLADFIKTHGTNPLGVSDVAAILSAVGQSQITKSNPNATLMDQTIAINKLATTAVTAAAGVALFQVGSNIAIVITAGTVAAPLVAGALTGVVLYATYQQFTDPNFWIGAAAYYNNVPGAVPVAGSAVQVIFNQMAYNLTHADNWVADANAMGSWCREISGALVDVLKKTGQFAFGKAETSLLAEALRKMSRSHSYESAKITGMETSVFSDYSSIMQRLSQKNVSSQFKGDTINQVANLNAKIQILNKSRTTAGLNDDDESGGVPVDASVLQDLADTAQISNPSVAPMDIAMSDYEIVKASVELSQNSTALTATKAALVNSFQILSPAYNSAMQNARALASQKIASPMAQISYQALAQKAIENYRMYNALKQMHDLTSASIKTAISLGIPVSAKIKTDFDQARKLIAVIENIKTIIQTANASPKKQVSAAQANAIIALVNAYAPSAITVVAFGISKTSDLGYGLCQTGRFAAETTEAKAAQQILTEVIQTGTILGKQDLQMQNDFAAFQAGAFAQMNAVNNQYAAQNQAAINQQTQQMYAAINTGQAVANAAATASLIQAAQATAVVTGYNIGNNPNFSSGSRIQSIETLGVPGLAGPSQAVNQANAQMAAANAAVALDAAAKRLASNYASNGYQPPVNSGPPEKLPYEDCSKGCVFIGDVIPVQ